MPPMQIHIHKPHIDVSDGFEGFAQQRIEDVLSAYLDRLTRVDVHLKDENSQKGGADKRCVVEARPRGLDPLAAEHHGDGIREAFTGALDKLHRVLEHQLGRLSTKRRPPG